METNLSRFLLQPVMGILRSYGRKRYGNPTSHETRNQYCSCSGTNSYPVFLTATDIRPEAGRATEVGRCCSQNICFIFVLPKTYASFKLVLSKRMLSKSVLPKLVLSKLVHSKLVLPKLVISKLVLPQLVHSKLVLPTMICPEL